MVRGLVELHAGEVSIASDGHDAGTEVTVRLPLIAGEAYGAPTPATSPGSDGRPSIADAGQSCDSRAERAERRTVLVIAKDAPVAASLKASLRLRGHDVETAEDGPTGLAFARTNRPNVVLCQLNLPGMDGFAVARAFREIDELAATHLVAIGNDVRPEDTQRSVDAGFDHHIGKPPCADLLDQLMVIGRATRITPEPPP
jgi:two-component system CheB/CheR fusion protein